MRYDYNIYILYMDKNKSGRCYSKCRRVGRADCHLPKCAYTDGASRKYCRLNTKKYVLDKSNGTCNTTRKKTAANRAIAGLEIQRFIRRRLAAKKVVKVTKSPAGVIGRFMRRTSKKRRAEFLKSICGDSGVCIAFGKESLKIIGFFLGFTDFTYLESVRRIGSVSANGFINELKYTRLGYDSHAVLKSNRGPSNDNLVYEYMVGQFINKMCLRFPCFVETYGLYKYNDEAAWTHVRDTVNLAKNVLGGLVTVVPKIGLDAWQTFNWGDACQSSKYYSILIQHIKGAQTLKSMLNDFTFINSNLLYVLYQVYMPLATIGDKYTHYDLHAENVQLYEPVRGKYIHYHYHLVGGKVVSFKSAYVAKIIDYGRSYFKDSVTANSVTPNSKRIHSHICMLGNCRPKCGADFGFSFLNEETVFGEAGYIISQKPNVSHDLRLIYDAMPRIPDTYAMKKFLKKYLNVVYDVKTKGRFKGYGTKENKVAGKGGVCNNINDAYMVLESMVTDLRILAVNDGKFPDPNMKLGDLHVYADGSPMRWVSL